MRGFNRFNVNSFRKLLFQDKFQDDCIIYFIFVPWYHFEKNVYHHKLLDIKSYFVSAKLYWLKWGETYNS